MSSCAAWCIPHGGCAACRGPVLQLNPVDHTSVDVRVFHSFRAHFPRAELQQALSNGQDGFMGRIHCAPYRSCCISVLSCVGSSIYAMLVKELAGCGGRHLTGCCITSLTLAHVHLLHLMLAPTCNRRMVVPSKIARALGILVVTA